MVSTPVPLPLFFFHRDLSGQNLDYVQEVSRRIPNRFRPSPAFEESPRLSPAEFRGALFSFKTCEQFESDFRNFQMAISDCACATLPSRCEGTTVGGIFRISRTNHVVVIFFFSRDASFLFVLRVSKLRIIYERRNFTVNCQSTVASQMSSYILPFWQSRFWNLLMDVDGSGIGSRCKTSNFLKFVNCIPLRISTEIG